MKDIRKIDITMADRVRKFGTHNVVRPTDKALVKLISKTGVDLNECLGCVNEENCIHVVEAGGIVMPCECIQ